MAPPTKVRLNADLSPDVANALKKLADSQGVSLTEALSRAIGTEATLADQRRKGGRRPHDADRFSTRLAIAKKRDRRADIDPFARCCRQNLVRPELFDTPTDHR